jgi:hypothetical protein
MAYDGVSLKIGIYAFFHSSLIFKSHLRVTSTIGDYNWNWILVTLYKEKGSNSMKTNRSVKQRMKSILKLTGGVIFASLALVSLSSWAGGDRIDVREPGRLYNELSGDWWNWAVQFPAAINPILEDDGAVDCTRGQKGKIWFLAGNFGGSSNRECTIPRGKALFFPVINTLWWVPEDGVDVAEVRAIANAQINATTFLEVSIDGVGIEDPFAYRAQSPPGGFALNFGPLLGDFGFDPMPDPRDPAVTDGYWILLYPLKKGVHDIRFRSVVGNLDDPDFELDVTYTLTVVDDYEGRERGRGRR